jgi:stage V sporulation protein B
MAGIKKLFKSVVTVTIFAVLTRTLSFIFKIYLSRTLGAEVVGLYQICLSAFFLFSALGASGLPTVLSRKIAEERALKPDSNGHAQITSTLILGILVSAVSIGIIYLFKPCLGAVFTDKRAVPLFYIMLPALLSSCIYSIIRSWFWGRKQFTYFSITETLEEVLRILFTALFVSGAFAGIGGAYGIALAFTISDATVAVLLIALFFFKGGRLQKPVRLSEIAKPALPVTAMRVFGCLASTLLAILLPARLIDAGYSISEATASFGRIAGMANPLLFAPNAIIASMTIVLVPEMSENGIKNNYQLLNRQINGGINFALLISGFFMVAFCALGRNLTELLFADTVSGEYLQAASLFMLLVPVNMITTSTLNSIGMEKENFFSFLAGTVFMLAAVYFLPQYIGLYSVVAATAISLILCCACNLYYLKKRINLRFGFLKTILMVSLFALPSIFFTKWVYALLVDLIGLFAMLLAFSAGSVMFGTLAYLFGVLNFESILNYKKLRKGASGIALS